MLVHNGEAIVDDLQWERASRYLAGELAGEEQRQFEAWLVEAPERRALLESLRTIYATHAPAGASVDIDAAWARMSARLDEAPAMQVARGERAGSQRWSNSITGRRRSWRMAAAAGVLVAAALSVPVIRNAVAPAALEVATGAGERRDIVLSDGSRVRLAPMSRVTMHGARRATLDGEAQFIVVHDAARPFAVETPDALVEDIGTVFVVRTSAAAGGTHVAVEEGVVSLAPAGSARAGDALILRVGESGRIGRGIGAVRGDSADWSRSVAWTRGEVVFDRTPLRDVAAELHRWFGVTVTFADPSLEARTLTARLSGASVSEALVAIGRSLGASHTRRGDTVTFSP